MDCAVVELDRAHADAGSKAHDSIPMNAGHALDGANACAFGKRADDGALLIKGKNVHGARSLQLGDGPTRLWKKPPKTAMLAHSDHCFGARSRE